MTIHTLIIGSGVAGLSLAIKLAELQPNHQILVVSKSHKSDSNTYYAQGGMAVVLDESDSFANHINDTLKAGHFLNDKRIVELVVKSAPERLKELIEWGAKFDIKPNGMFDLGLEGGHSKNRIVHHKDKSGKEIYRILTDRASCLSNIEIIENLFVTDLIQSSTNENQCLGVHAIDLQNNKSVSALAQNTVIASGGIGQAFQRTTNPRSATGDGIALASRAGVLVKDMNYIQFHPTALYCDENPTFLISEAVRGFGAYLVNAQGERFMLNYDSRLELATRDVISYAMLQQMKRENTDHLFLDCRHLNHHLFRKSFPVIHEKCDALNINPANDLIPVAPAAHYLCGGIVVDASGKTNLKNLYACGESTSTGLHGANRLASNSLLEALVFADIIARQLAKLPLKVPSKTEFQPIQKFTSCDTDLELVVAKIKSIMTQWVGIDNEIESLKIAETKINQLEVLFQGRIPPIHSSVIAIETLNLISVAKLIIKQSIQSKSNN